MEIVDMKECSCKIPKPTKMGSYTGCMECGGKIHNSNKISNPVREILDGTAIKTSELNKNNRIYDAVIPKLDAVDGLLVGTVGEVSPMPTCARCLTNIRVKPDKNGYVHCTNCGNYWLPSKIG